MKAYPYARWPSVEASALPVIRRVARGQTDPEPFVKVLAELAGCEARIDTPTFRAVCPEEREAAFAGPRAAIALVDDQNLDRRCLVELTPPLASSLIDRLLGGDGDLRDGLGQGLSEGQRGVLAFAASELISKCGLTLRVATVMRSAKPIVRFLGPITSAVWSATTTLGEVTGAVRVWAPMASLPSDVPALSLRNASVVFVGDIAEGLVSGETLRALTSGDVIFFDRKECWRVEEELECRLRALGGTRTTWWLAAGVIRRIEESTSAVSARGERMDKGSDTEATRPGPATTTAAAGYEEATRPIADGLSAVGDAPVTVALEIARFTLPLDEIARLAPGEVVHAGAQIGDEARLRVGDRVLAVGELVDIEGQVGLRIRRLP